MKLIFALLMCVSVFAQDYEFTKEDREKIDRDGKRLSREIRDDIAAGRMNAMARRADEAIRYMVARGNAELRKKGDTEGAHFYEFKYRTEFDGFLTKMVSNDRMIGDHKPLSEFLSTYYKRLELILGIDVCKSLHLSDIYSLNHALPIVFRPCTFPMDAVTIPRKAEYQNHFNEDFYYYGFFPVLVYWVIDAPCLLMTSGVGAFFCGPIASVAEYSAAKFLGPKLSDSLFDRFCDNN